MKLLTKDNKLQEYTVNAADRKHNSWKRDAMSIELYSPAVFYQKMNYIHYNPVPAGLCELPEEYKYSSALFYHSGKDQNDLLDY